MFLGFSGSLVSLKRALYSVQQTVQSLKRAVIMYVMMYVDDIDNSSILSQVLSQVHLVTSPHHT